jgi:hypothetical protein
MRQQFRQPKISKANRIRLDQINNIIQEYQAAGYVLTLRQLYYQLVSRDIIPNVQAEYGKLSRLLKEGRMGGLVDWDAIEDRLRKPDKPSSWSSPASIMQAAIDGYARDRQEGQDIYLEVWVEKDALSGVLKRVTEQYHIPIMVNRGYSSVSAVYEAYNRFRRNCKDRPGMVLYLGDFDPSGLDMIRDIEDRMYEFGVGREEFAVKPIALTIDQINEYDPPPNPAKVTDPRAAEYIMRHGDTSWEVDALRPEVLNQILRDAILEEIDIMMFEGVMEQEEEDKAKLIKLKNKLYEEDE